MERRSGAIAVVLLAAIMVAMGVGGCSGSKAATAPSQATAVFVDAKVAAKPVAARPEGPPASRLAAPVWNFGLDLLTRQAAKSGENIVVSPVSLSAALSMTMVGARGDTAMQMRHALRFDSVDADVVGPAWANLIAESNATERAQVRIADSLWLRNGVSYVPAFLSANRDYFAADARSLPGDLAEAPAQINGWVAERTGNRIRDLVSTVPESTALVLVNTVYAKVGWDCFEPQRTESRPFTLGEGATVQVPTMEGHMAAEVAITPEYDAVPVETNGELTFWVVVPKGSQTPESVAALLGERGVAALSKDATYAEVDLQLPRFRIEYTADALDADLTAMGMPDAFSSASADFSGMANVKGLCISSVIQKAMIDVSERGIEAAAGSAVMMDGAGPPTEKLTVHADRPFLVALLGSYTEAPLFMALVRDPR